MGSTDVEYDLVSFQPGQTSEATRKLNEQLMNAAQKDRKWWEVGDQFFSLFPEDSRWPKGGNDHLLTQIPVL